MMWFIALVFGSYLLMVLYCYRAEIGNAIWDYLVGVPYQPRDNWPIYPSKPLITKNLGKHRDLIAGSTCKGDYVLCEERHMPTGIEQTWQCVECKQIHFEVAQCPQL